MASKSIKIPPFNYIHVLDKNSNVTRLETGPLTFIKQDHETIVTGQDPIKMIVLPTLHFTLITNPVVMENGKPVVDKFGQVIVKHGETEYRFAHNYLEPFPLYPKEISSAVSPLKVVKQMKALKLQATRNFKNDDSKEIQAGDEWLFPGPGIYYPRVEEKVVCEVSSHIIVDQQALRLKAKEKFTDKNGTTRNAGEEWLVREPGAYLPSVFEEVVKIETPMIIDETNALLMRGTQNFTDIYGKARKAGEEWLITNDVSSFHIADIHEEWVKTVAKTVLKKQEYCVVLDPYDSATNTNRLGAKELRQGESSFFLQPGESLEHGIQTVFILDESKALLLSANEKFTEKVKEKDSKGAIVEKSVEHQPGDRWMVYGPCSFVPPTSVTIIEQREKIPLDKNEGIYVRDTRTGLVRSVIGQTYMLLPHEELWSMEVPSTVEKILQKENASDGNRIKYKVVTFRCPHNCAVQIFDFKLKKSRIELGPKLVMLAPDEQFTISVLSGGKPKVPGKFTVISVMLGPDFSTDIVEVETSDHAALRLKLSYNWYFKIDKNKPETIEKIFNVKNFIGEICNILASKVRSAVASVDFDSFHKSSARIIRKAIFGIDENGKINDEFLNDKNNLCVTNVDIQNVEPVDPETRKNLQKTVTIAIEITTSRQEARARHNANKMEQEAKGELEKLKIEDDSKAETVKQELLKLKAESEEVRSQGQAIADAKAKAEAEEIFVKAQLEIAELKAKAMKITSDSAVDQESLKQKQLLSNEKELAELEIYKSQQLSEIEASKAKEMINSLGQETLVAMANAGPEFQAQLLQGLGLQGYLLTDGNNPINLMSTAEGLLGGFGAGDGSK